MIQPDWKKRIPRDFSGASRVWIYQSSRPFTPDEVPILEDRLQYFVDSWMSHNRPVNGWAALLFNQFLVLMADDTADRLCGSAIDGSIRFVKDLENQMKVALMDRLQMAFLQPDSDALALLTLDKVQDAINRGAIQEETLFFNNAVTTKDQLLNNWLVPLKNSFLWTRFSKSSAAL